MPHVDKFNGISIISYNTVAAINPSVVQIAGKSYDGFYISYNDYDVDMYGDVTTGLVLGQGQRFYILNGDHTEAYKEAAADGFLRCMEYFRAHLDQINKYSDKP